MSIVVYCKDCGKKIRCNDEFAGKRGKCPQCGVWVPVPMQSEERPPFGQQGKTGAFPTLSQTKPDESAGATSTSSSDGASNPGYGSTDAKTKAQQNHNKNDDEREMTGWKTSATLKQAIQSLFKPNDAVANFRVFALPSLIKSIWLIFSWLIICGGIILAIALPIIAASDGEKQYAANQEKLREQKYSYCTEISSKSEKIMDRIEVCRRRNVCHIL